MQHNLPRDINSFVGRDDERAEVTNLLGSSQLLTLVGPGGVGKTRLAVQVASEALADYPDGVWLVELGPLARGDLVPLAIAQVLGVAVDPFRPEENLEIPKQVPDDEKNQNNARRRHNHFPSDG